MAEQSLQERLARHEQCRCGEGLPHCSQCLDLTWPCTAAAAREALERLLSAARPVAALFDQWHAMKRDDWAGIPDDWNANAFRVWEALRRVVSQMDGLGASHE